MGAVIRRGDNKFVLPLQDLTLGNTYKVAVNADGRRGQHLCRGPDDVSFKVVARPQETITLNPGMNLVSFPEIPAEPGINEIFRRRRPAWTWCWPTTRPSTCPG